MRDESKGKKRHEKPILTGAEEAKMGEHLKAGYAEVTRPSGKDVQVVPGTEGQLAQLPKPEPAPAYVPPVVEVADVKAKKAGEFFGDRRIKLAVVRFKEPEAGGNFGAEFTFRSDRVHLTMIDDDYVEVRALDNTGQVVLSPMSNVACVTLA